MPFYTHDVVPDSPINNFCTGNPLAKKWGSAKITHRYGWTDGHGGSKATNISSIEIPPTGAWYFEILHPNTQAPVFVLQQGTMAFGTYGDSNTGMEILSTSGIPLGGAYEWQSPKRTNNGDYPRLPVGQGVVGYYIDMENGMFVLKCGSNCYDYSFTHNGWINFDKNKPIHMGMGNGGAAGEIMFNFGTNPTLNSGLTSTQSDEEGYGFFMYDPKSLSGPNTSYVSTIAGKVLCTANLPEGPIKLSQDQTPSDNFKALTYTGSIGNDQLVDCGFPADFIWIKGRTASFNTAHMLYDTVRGRTSVLSSNNTDYEFDYGNLAPTFSTASNSINGFKTPPVTNNNINDSGSTYVAWCWKAAGAPAENQAKIINEDGSAMDATDAEAVRNSGSIVPSKISANRQNGFSIVKYTGNNTDGASLPHGLNQRPDFFIIKNLTKSAGDNWIVASVGDFNISNNIGDGHLVLNSSNQADGSSGFFTSTPDSNVIYLGGGSSVRDPVNTTYDYIAYCWHSVAGYSKFGAYVGNGSADGPMVYCGFRPAWVMAKRTDTSTSNTSWIIFDNARESNNAMTSTLYANRSAAEGYRGDGTTANPDIAIDFLSNGMKIRTGRDEIGAGTFIFMAFAEQPFSGPANAR